MRVLLTAFEPFDGTGLNSSLQGCLALLVAGPPPGVEVRFAELPCEYGADTLVVEEALGAGPVDLVLHTGQTDAEALAVERLAVNVRYRHARLCVGTHAPIDPGGPAAFLASLPVDAVVDALRTAELPATVSNHAGVYLCNHVLYRSLQRGPGPWGSPRIGFLHVPRLPEQRSHGGGLTAAEVARGLTVILEALRAVPHGEAFRPL